MTALFLLRCLAAVFCGLSFMALAASVAGGLMQARINARRPRRADQPAVSVVIPIRDFDGVFIEAQTSVCNQLYPHYDITITARDTESQAGRAARIILNGYPQLVTRLVQSEATFAVSPKVNNLYQAVMDAPDDIIFMKDSNIIIPDNGIASAVASMGEGVGLVVAIPEARGASGFASEIEASIMNQSHGRLLLLADAAGLGFGVGKLMVFRRSDLLRAGGFAAISESVGEDSALAHALAGLGLRTVFMGPPIVQKLGIRRLRDVYNRQLRWTVIRSNNEKLAFLAEPLGLATCAALAAAFAAPLFGWSPLAGAGLMLFLWWALETLLALARGWDVSLWSPAIMVARDGMMLGVWIQAWFTRRVVWSSDVYDAHRPPGEPRAGVSMTKPGTTPDSKE